MPRSSMKELRERATEAILAIVPDVWPDAPFRVASGDCELALQTFGDRLDGTRRFHVLPGPLGAFRGAEFSSWSGTTAIMRDSLEVRVRYEMPTADDGYLTVVDMISTDQQVLAWALTTQVADMWVEGASSGNAVVNNIQPNGTIQTDPIQAEDGALVALIVRYQYDIITQLGEDT
jgi:hypothetical protein